MGQFFHTKNEKKYFEKKINERYGECSFFYIKIPINIESHMYKETNKDGAHFSRYLFSDESELEFSDLSQAEL